MEFGELPRSTGANPVARSPSSWAEPGPAASRPRRSEGSRGGVAGPTRDPSLRL